MFSRQSKDPKPSETPDMMFPSLSEEEDTHQEHRELSKMADSSQSEVINIVEKVSGIISPYFIVIVGLLLYEDNLFLGLLLITVGMFSLLKISWGDISVFFTQIKNLLSGND